MKCPCCGEDMTAGYIQSARKIYFTTKQHHGILIADEATDILLSHHNWSMPVCDAYHCPACHLVISRHVDENGRKRV